MSPPKEPSKEPSLPSQDESRRVNVLYEKMMSEFRTFGEGLSLLREDVNNMKPQLAKIDKLSDDMEIVKLAVGAHGKAIQSLHVDVSNLKSDVSILKSDVSIVKSDVAEIKGDIKGYNQRLQVVETKLAS